MCVHILRPSRAICAYMCMPVHVYIPSHMHIHTLYIYIRTHMYMHIYSPTVPHSSLCKQRDLYDAKKKKTKAKKKPKCKSKNKR